MTKSICILRLSALGDVLMLVPLVRALQAQLPGVAISWIIARPAYDLVAGMDGVEFIVIDKPKSVRDYWVFRKQLRSRTFDLLLATQAALRTNLLIPLIRAKRKIGYDRRRANDGQRLFVTEQIQPGLDHTVEGFLKFGAALGLATTPPEWRLPIDQEAQDWASTYCSDQSLTVVINPAASKPERSWLPDRYAAVIQHLQTNWGATVILVGGPGTHDRRLADAILKLVSVTDLVGKTKPKQLLALISQADLVLSPDTGPAHMATAVGTPVVTLHAVTNPALSGPYLFKADSVNYYPQAMKTFLNQTVNEKTWGTQVHNDKAMQLIPVSVVIEQVDKIIGRKGC